MSNSLGSGRQQASVGNVPPTQNQQTRAGQAATRKQAPFIMRLLKIIGACLLAVFAFHVFKIAGLLLVALLIIGLFMFNKQTSGSQKTLFGAVREIGATISEFFGMIITICGVVVLISGLTPPALFLSAAGIIMIIAGLIVWIKTRRS